MIKLNNWGQPWQSSQHVTLKTSGLIKRELLVNPGVKKHTSQGQLYLAGWTLVANVLQCYKWEVSKTRRKQEITEVKETWSNNRRRLTTFIILHHPASAMFNLSVMQKKVICCRIVFFRNKLYNISFCTSVPVLLCERIVFVCVCVEITVSSWWVSPVYGCETTPARV